MTTRLALLAFVLAASSLLAQPAQLTNAQVRAVPAGTLARTLDQQLSAATSTGWIAWSVPIVKGDRMICDWSDESRRVPTTSVKLEGPDILFVFLRVEARELTRVRMFSEGCAIDAGGVAGPGAMDRNVFRGLHGLLRQQGQDEGDDSHDHFSLPDVILYIGSSRFKVLI